MDANSFTIDGVTITKAEFIKALSGAKRVPTEWQNKKIRIASATAEYTYSPAFDEKAQTVLGTIGIGVANVFAKISFALTMVDIAGTYWYFEINGLPMDVFATNAGFVINGISLGFNWLTYELSQYLSKHMNDWYDASELTEADSEATGESTATEEGSEAEEESETEGTGKSVDDIINDIPKDLKDLGKCDEFADALEDGMRENGISGERLKVESDFGIYSDKAGKVIGETGYHDAIKIGDKVYDNMTPEGMNYADWLKDLGIGLDPNISCDPLYTIN